MSSKSRVAKCFSCAVALPLLRVRLRSEGAGIRRVEILIREFGLLRAMVIVITESAAGGMNGVVAERVAGLRLLKSLRLY